MIRTCYSQLDSQPEHLPAYLDWKPSASTRVLLDPSLMVTELLMGNVKEYKWLWRSVYLCQSIEWSACWRSLSWVRGLQPCQEKQQNNNKSAQASKDIFSKNLQERSYDPIYKPRLLRRTGWKLTDDVADKFPNQSKVFSVGFGLLFHVSVKNCAVYKCITDWNST